MITDDIRALKRLKLCDPSLFLVLILLAFIVGLRGITVGTDTKLYCSIYSNYETHNFAFAINQTKYIGWSVYVFLLTRIGVSYQFYLLITSLLIAVFLYKIIIFFSPKQKRLLYVIFYILFYFFCSTMNVFRFYFAITISLFATTLFLEKKYIWYLFFEVIAISIHATLIITLILPFLYCIVKKKWHPIYIGLLLLFALIICSFSDVFIQTFVNLFPAYSDYFSSTTENLSSTSQGRSVILRIVEVLIGIWFLLFAKRGLNTIAGRFLLLLFFLSNILGAVYYNQILLQRLLSILLVYDFITIPFFLNYVKLKNKRRIATVFCLTIFSVLYITMLKGNYGEVIPYIIC